MGRQLDLFALPAVVGRIYSADLGRPRGAVSRGIVCVVALGPAHAPGLLTVRRWLDAERRWSSPFTLPRALLLAVSTSAAAQRARRKPPKEIRR